MLNIADLKPRQTDSAAYSGEYINQYTGEAGVVTLYKRAASTDAWGGERYYYPASYSMFFRANDGKLYRIFSHEAPGRKFRTFLKAAQELGQQVADKGMEVFS